MNEALATLCLDHLQHEDTLLKTALSIVCAIKAAFSERTPDAFVTGLSRHREFSSMVGAIQQRRRHFAETAAGQLGVASAKVTISAVLEHLPKSCRADVAEAAERVRGLAHELAAANFVVSVHVRVHLNAYRRILAM